MSANIGFDKCLTFINCQIKPADGRQVAAGREPAAFRAVTISRQTGSGGHEVASHLATMLQARLPNTGRSWTVFDRELVGKVLEDHHLPQRLARYLPEDRISYLSDTIDELFGLHPPSDEFVRQTAKTILRLADLGNVIIIGRGATVVTAKLDYVFHVRLVSEVKTRADYLEKLRNISHKAALDLIEKEDRGRARYLKAHYRADINDPLLYHLVINTGRIPYKEAAKLIADAMAASPRPE